MGPIRDLRIKGTRPGTHGPWDPVVHVMTANSWPAGRLDHENTTQKREQGSGVPFCRCSGGVQLVQRLYDGGAGGREGRREGGLQRARRPASPLLLLQVVPYIGQCTFVPLPAGP